MTDSRKELLMPATQKDPAAAPIKIKPSALVFNLNPESPAVTPDKVIEEPINNGYKNIAIFFQQRTSRPQKLTKKQTIKVAHLSRECWTENDRKSSGQDDLFVQNFFG